MADPAKLAMLRLIPYTLIPGCGECAHARFAPGSSFGQCTLSTYRHAKHGVRPLSVHRAGRCYRFDMNAKKGADIERSGFTDFIHEPIGADGKPLR